MTVRNDFNHDGRSDILWRDQSGFLAIASATSAGGFTAGSPVVGWPATEGLIFTGDFNGDGRGDYFLKQGGFHYMAFQIGNGSFPFDFQETYSIPDGRIISAAVDLNGDGQTDLLLRDGNGRITDLLAVNGPSFWWDFVTPQAYLSPNDAVMTVDVDPSWKLATTGDFNGDGKADLLWQNDNGAIFDFLGTAAGGVVNNGDNSWMMLENGWHVVGAGDFNGDRRDDILLRNDAGTIIDYLATANGGFTDNRANLNTTVANDWRVVGIGDYNGDGRADILLRNTNGAIFNFLGTANGGVVNNGDNSWTMIPTALQVQDTFVHDPFV